MWKIIGTVKRKPGTTREEFQHYYESHHALLAHEVAGDFAVDYRRNYIVDSSGLPVQGTILGGTNLDCVTEFFFPNREALNAMIAFQSRPGYAEYVVADEAVFVDREDTRYVLAEEVPDIFSLSSRPHNNLLKGLK